MRFSLPTLLLFSALTHAAEPALAKMPVKEVTVFKDGHAYVVHEGTLPTTDKGEVLLDQLPSPVMGTFWPYVQAGQGTLKSVTAASTKVNVEQTATNFRELIEANIGAEVLLTEGTKPSYQARLLEVLSKKPADGPADRAVSYSPYIPPSTMFVVLAKTDDGTKAVPVEAITELKFRDKYNTKFSQEQQRNLLTMTITHANAVPPKNVNVGMAYVQKGLRWIPHYKIELNDQGKALVKMQATLINELTDLKDVTMNLVIGVPSFQFKDTADPMAFQQTMAALGQYFQGDSNSNYSMSNGMMTQNVAGFGQGVAPQGPAFVQVPNDVVDPKQSDDLYVFTIKNITLAKGARMVIPISEQVLGYKDVYTLDIPYAPPQEMRVHANTPAAAEYAKLMAEPKVMHKIRVANNNDQPFTTAPAMILKNGKIVAQGMMLYTSKGGAADITLTAAIDVKVTRSDEEKKRVAIPDKKADNVIPNQVYIESNLTLTNASGKPIEVEVTRFVLGNVDEKQPDGVKATMLGLLEESADPRPLWWSYYSWPYWWVHLNGIGKFKFTMKMEPGKQASQQYTWTYYWR
jgi:hypothetical protein